MNAELKRINAKIACQQTCEAIFRAYAPVIDKAFDRIHGAIKAGCTYVAFDSRNFHCDFNESEVVELCKTQKYFEALGYSFNIDSAHVGTCVVTIDWGKNL